MIKGFDGKEPDIHLSAFVAHGVVVIGDVRLGEDSSIWYNCVIRGDEHPVIIGKKTNIQDLSMCHETGAVGPLIIGDEVTVGHGAILHGCTIHDRVLIGMGAIVMDRAVIGEDAIVAPGAVVMENTVVEPGTMVAGIPAKVKRAVTDIEKARNAIFAAHYVEHARKHKNL